MPLAKLTMREFIGTDLADAQRLARHLGYTQTAYTSTSALIGLWCLRATPKQRAGCIIHTQELGMLFVQDPHDTNMPEDRSERRNGK